ncbi:uncharacterized protein Z518_03854 [Rhinocladiella mackenziei CBS 650.93]|uniref:Uncharacterized protein n=1 Tax=Rhinocladiella mackenziei CBS 650.93 TaxID=1442369 RepID=A0A0D2IRW5_9EURO|nr:uncharacterized protein Z518_03854 [Rhinocladiella mackenziei CBS 650.93]KIX05881.1 hypothetical protein Z518_03854 [Rhinocladiella mackenziei CBS 650.93]
MRVSLGQVATCIRPRCLRIPPRNPWVYQHLFAHFQPQNTPSLAQLRQWSSCFRRNSSTTSTHAKDHLSCGSRIDLPLDESSVRHSSDTFKWATLLEEASVYGIRSKERLCFEADVGHRLDIGSRLVDQPAARQNIDLWLLLLRAQALQNGHEGIKAIWRGLTYRGNAIRLDDKDPAVNTLWQLFLSAGSDDRQFLWSLCNVSKRAIFERPRLFAEIVGASLEGSSPQDAPLFAGILVENHYRGRDDLLGTFHAASRSTHPHALRDFQKIYNLVPKTHIYAEVTSALWKQDRSSDAFMMHSFLVSKGDLPPYFEALEPFIHHLAIHDKNLNSFLMPLDLAGASFEGQARRLWSKEKSRLAGMSAESLNIVASKTMGITPRKLSDQFVARAFATRAFSFDFAVNSLRMIGLIEVGPLAVREMTLTSPDLATLQARFQKLQELEIDTGSSRLVQILKNVCDVGRWEMVQALVNNDLHHEVFENLQLQKQLLKEYYRKQDWLQINRTLAIINNGRFDTEAQKRASEMLITCMLDVGDWDGAISLATNAQVRGWSISSALPRVIRQIIKYTKAGEFHHSTNVDRIAFFIGMLQNILGSGTYFGMELWRRPLRALGSFGRMREFESLVYWIAEWYRPKGLHEQDLTKPLSEKLSDLNVLFNDKFQKALIAWCFRAHKGMATVSPELCLRWTRVLKRLRDRHGVQVKEHIIRWAFIANLRRLFRPNWHLRPRHNRIRARNTATLSRYWQLYDAMWDMKPEGKVRYKNRHQAVLSARQPRKFLRKRGSHLMSRQSRFSAEQTSTRAVHGRMGQNNVPEDIVMYRDLFNASWEDYRK